jgi:hypothetical protein
MRKIIPALLIGLLASACSSIDCPVQNVVATVYGLYKSDGTADTLTDTLTILTRRSDGTDSILLNRSVGTKSFQLPVSYTRPEDTLLFVVKSAAATDSDYVYIKKESYPHFESVDCNIAFFHQITSVRLGSNNAIDSITINKAYIDYDLSTEHLHIYFKNRD